MPLKPGIWKSPSPSEWGEGTNRQPIAAGALEATLYASLTAREILGGSTMSGSSTGLFAVSFTFVFPSEE